MRDVKNILSIVSLILRNSKKTDIKNFLYFLRNFIKSINYYTYAFDTKNISTNIYKKDIYNFYNSQFFFLRSFFNFKNELNFFFLSSMSNQLYIKNKVLNEKAKYSFVILNSKKLTSDFNKLSFLKKNDIIGEDEDEFLLPRYSHIIESDDSKKEIKDIKDKESSLKYFKKIKEQGYYSEKMLDKLYFLNLLGGESITDLSFELAIFKIEKHEIDINDKKNQDIDANGKYKSEFDYNKFYIENNDIYSVYSTGFKEGENERPWDILERKDLKKYFGYSDDDDENINNYYGRLFSQIWENVNKNRLLFISFMTESQKLNLINTSLNIISKFYIKNINDLNTKLFCSNIFVKKLLYNNEYKNYDFYIYYIGIYIIIINCISNYPLFYKKSILPIIREVPYVKTFNSIDLIKNNIFLNININNSFTLYWNKWFCLENQIDILKEKDLSIKDIACLFLYFFLENNISIDDMISSKKLLMIPLSFFSFNQYHITEKPLYLVFFPESLKLAEVYFEEILKRYMLYFDFGGIYKYMYIHGKINKKVYGAILKKNLYDTIKHGFKINIDENLIESKYFYKNFLALSKRKTKSDKNILQKRKDWIETYKENKNSFLKIINDENDGMVIIDNNELNNEILEFDDYKKENNKIICEHLNHFLFFMNAEKEQHQYVELKDNFLYFWINSILYYNLNFIRMNKDLILNNKEKMNFIFILFSMIYNILLYNNNNILIDNINILNLLCYIEENNNLLENIKENGNNVLRYNVLNYTFQEFFLLNSKSFIYENITDIEMNNLCLLFYFSYKEEEKRYLNLYNKLKNNYLQVNLYKKKIEIKNKEELISEIKENIKIQSNFENISEIDDKENELNKENEEKEIDKENILLENKEVKVEQTINEEENEEDDIGTFDEVKERIIFKSEKLLNNVEIEEEKKKKYWQKAILNINKIDHTEFIKELKNIRKEILNSIRRYLSKYRIFRNYFIFKQKDNNIIKISKDKLLNKIIKGKALWKKNKNQELDEYNDLMSYYEYLENEKSINIKNKEINALEKGIEIRELEEIKETEDIIKENYNNSVLNNEFNIHLFKIKGKNLKSLSEHNDKNIYVNQEYYCQNRFVNSGFFETFILDYFKIKLKRQPLDNNIKKKIYKIRKNNLELYKQKIKTIIELYKLDILNIKFNYNVKKNIKFNFLNKNNYKEKNIIIYFFFKYKIIIIEYFKFILNIFYLFICFFKKDFWILKKNCFSILLNNFVMKSYFIYFIFKYWSYFIDHPKMSMFIYKQSRKALNFENVEELNRDDFKLLSYKDYLIFFILKYLHKLQDEEIFLKRKLKFLSISGGKHADLCLKYKEQEKKLKFLYKLKEWMFHSQFSEKKKSEALEKVNNKVDVINFNKLKKLSMKYNFKFIEMLPYFEETFFIKTNSKILTILNYVVIESSEKNKKVDDSKQNIKKDSFLNYQLESVYPFFTLKDDDKSLYNLNKNLHFLHTDVIKKKGFDEKIKREEKKNEIVAEEKIISTVLEKNYEINLLNNDEKKNKDKNINFLKKILEKIKIKN